MLTPGSHTILLSSDALTGMLRTIGFKMISIDSDASSHRVVAARTIKEGGPKQDFDQRYHDYLLKARDRAEPGTPLYKGLSYRLYRQSCDTGNWERAEKYFEPRLVSESADLSDISSYEDFASRFALCVAPMTYYRGMQMLNQYGEPESAAKFFASAVKLCEKKIDIAPNYSVVEEDILWWAWYHEALALSHSGKEDEAKFIARHILDSPCPAVVKERTRRQFNIRESPMLAP
jgi:hypothetical protein